MPTLHWIGKDKVVNHHTEIPYQVLKKSYHFSVDDSRFTMEENYQSKNVNKIIHGDNLIALKSLLPQYENQIKCIYIDPPYNTGNENWVYNDNVNSPEMQRWLGKTVGKDAEDLTRHDKWLCMMYPRLVLLRKLLRNDGVIFMSIDDNEQANLKLLCDEIFGAGDFVGTIGWESKTKSQNTETSFNKLQPKIEFILCYAKEKNKRFNLMKIGEKNYPETDEKGIFRYKNIEQMNAEGTRGRETMIFPILGILPEKNKQWKIGSDTVNHFLEREDLLLINHKPFQKIRPNDERNNLTEPFWAFFSKEIGTGESAKRELNKIFYPDSHHFETVKPTELIKRLIFHSTDSDSIILDSFAGSGTTAHAVLNLNAQDGGNRKFILIECEEYAESITAERVKRVMKGFAVNDSPLTNENSESENRKPKTKNQNGFSYYELGEVLLNEDGFLNENANLADIRAYIWYSETGESFRDLGFIVYDLQSTENENQDNPYFLGEYHQRSYYFYYEKDRSTHLDFDFLASIRQPSESYLIYADVCYLDSAFLESNKIIFKKIPRDISRF